MHETLSGQALKAIFKLKSYFNKFTDFLVSHMLGLLVQRILPILTYGSEVSGFSKADNIERTHLQFCKHLLGVKIQTQTLLFMENLEESHGLVSVIRYWFKVIQCDDAKYTKLTYNIMLNDLKKFQPNHLGPNL